MSLSWAGNWEVETSTSIIAVEFMKLVMSASVTVRPMVLNCRPSGRSSKKKPSPTVSTRCSPVFDGDDVSPHPPTASPRAPPSPASEGGLGWGLLNHALVLQRGDLGRREAEPAAIDLGIVLAHSRARPGRGF